MAGLIKGLLTECKPEGISTTIRRTTFRHHRGSIESPPNTPRVLEVLSVPHYQ